MTVLGTESCIFLTPNPMDRLNQVWDQGTRGGDRVAITATGAFHGIQDAEDLTLDILTAQTIPA